MDYIYSVEEARDKIIGMLIESTGWKYLKSRNCLKKTVEERLYNSNFEDVDKDVIHWEVLPIKSKQRISVHFISVNSENRQGIRLAIDAGKGISFRRWNIAE